MKAATPVVSPNPMRRRADLSSVEDKTHALLKSQGERIRQARKRAGLSIEKVSQLTGLHFNTVGRIERADAACAPDQLLMIAEVLGVDPQGIGLFEPPEPAVSATEDDEFVLIDMLDVNVSAGAGSMNGDPPVVGRFAFKRDWLTNHGVAPAHARIVRARGDSMADRINDGDILLVDTAVKQLGRDGIYVIEIGGHDYVKRLQRDLLGGVQIISFNPGYHTLHLTASQLHELRISGKVVWHGGEL